jgi:hypothetical protein
VQCPTFNPSRTKFIASMYLVGDVEDTWSILDLNMFAKVIKI